MTSSRSSARRASQPTWRKWIDHGVRSSCMAHSPSIRLESWPHSSDLSPTPPSASLQPALSTRTTYWSSRRISSLPYRHCKRPATASWPPDNLFSPQPFKEGCLGNCLKAPDYGFRWHDEQRTWSENPQPGSRPCRENGYLLVRGAPGHASRAVTVSPGAASGAPRRGCGG